MPSTTTQAQLKASVDSFVAELTTLIQQSTIESIQEAIGGALAAPKRASKAPTRRKAPARPKKRVRRSSANVEAMTGKIAAYVTANPGCAVSDIAGSLGVTTKDVRLPIQKLMGDGAIKVTGQKRGTRYHPGKGSSKPTAKKAGRKKKATRKKATGRKKIARK